MSTNTKEELDQKSAIAVDNFLKAYERLPSEKRPKFREANFKLQNRYPQVFVKYWSDNPQESAEAMQWLKDRHNELAAKVGEGLIK